MKEQIYYKVMGGAVIVLTMILLLNINIAAAAEWDPAYRFRHRQDRMG